YLYDGSSTITSNGVDTLQVHAATPFPEIALGASILKVNYTSLFRKDLSSDNNDSKFVQYPRLMNINLDLLFYPKTNIIDTTNFYVNGFNSTSLKYSSVGIRLSIQGYGSFWNLGKHADMGIYYLFAVERNILDWVYNASLGLYVGF